MDDNQFTMRLQFGLSRTATKANPPSHAQDLCPASGLLARCHCGTTHCQMVEILYCERRTWELRWEMFSCERPTQYTSTLLLVVLPVLLSELAECWQCIVTERISDVVSNSLPPLQFRKQIARMQRRYNWLVAILFSGGSNWKMVSLLDIMHKHPSDIARLKHTLGSEFGRW